MISFMSVSQIRQFWLYCSQQIYRDRLFSLFLIFNFDKHILSDVLLLFFKNTSFLKTFSSIVERFFLKFAEIHSNQYFILDDNHFLHFYISLFLYFFISLLLHFFISLFLFFYFFFFLFLYHNIVGTGKTATVLASIK